MTKDSIVNVEAIPVNLPFCEQVSDSWGEYRSSNHGIVRVTAQDGTQGIGEISLAWFGGAHALCGEVNRLWAPRLEGHDCTQIGEMIAIMDALCAFSKRHLLAKAGVEMALWDLLGKKCDMSVARLMGGRLRERIPLTGGIPMASPDDMARIARLRVQQGYRELKLKVGLSEERDIEGARRVREAIPDYVRLRADANMAWTDRRQALRMMDALHDLGVHMIEQPMDAQRLEDIAWLRARARSRILIDEGVWDVYDAKACLEAGAADLLHVYTCEAGGLAGVRRIAELARLYHVPCTLGSMPEGCIGAAASAQAAACMDNLADEPSDIRGFTVYATDVTREGLTIEDGELIVPDRPGLGVTLDEEKLYRVRVREAVEK